MLIFLHSLTLLSLSLFLMFPLCFHLQLHQGLFPIKLGLFHLSFLLKLVINLFLGPFTFVLETLLLSIYTILPNHSHLILLVTFQLNSNIMLFVNLSCHLNLLLLMYFAPVSLCQCVNVVRLVFCHPHVSFLSKPLFAIVNLVGPVTVYNVKSVNSQHICRVFPSMHCTASVDQNFSHRRHENVTSFPLPSSNLLPPVIKSHLSPLTLMLNLSARPSFPPGTLSPPNFQHVSSSIKICLFLMTMFNTILLNQPIQ